MVADINVRRNLHKPRFLQEEFVATVLETHPLDEPVLTFQGEDKDSRVSVLSVYQGNALAYLVL